MADVHVGEVLGDQRALLEEVRIPEHRVVREQPVGGVVLVVAPVVSPLAEPVAVVHQAVGPLLPAVFLVAVERPPQVRRVAGERGRQLVGGDQVAEHAAVGVGVRLAAGEGVDRGGRVAAEVEEQRVPPLEAADERVLPPAEVEEEPVLELGERRVRVAGDVGRDAQPGPALGDAQPLGVVLPEVSEWPPSHPAPGPAAPPSGRPPRGRRRRSSEIRYALSIHWKTSRSGASGAAASSRSSDWNEVISSWRPVVPKTCSTSTSGEPAVTRSRRLHELSSSPPSPTCTPSRRSTAAASPARSSSASRRPASMRYARPSSPVSTPLRPRIAEGATVDRDRLEHGQRRAVHAEAERAGVDGPAPAVLGDAQRRRRSGALAVGQHELDFSAGGQVRGVVDVQPADAAVGPAGGHGQIRGDPLARRVRSRPGGPDRPACPAREGHAHPLRVVR